MSKKSQYVEKGDKYIPVKGKKGVIFAVILIIIIIVLGQVLYLYVIPRLTIDFKTVYHEATGGGGTGGLFNVNTKFKNSGTLEVNNFVLSLKIFNSTKAVLKSEVYESDFISAGESKQIKIISNGNCFETYYIEIEVEFFVDNEDYYEKFNYKTYEDAMNIGFEDSIFDWGF